MQNHRTPAEPNHVAGMHKGEEFVLKKGHEPGRGGEDHYRKSRDSTGINPDRHRPILPSMPNIPPA